MADTPVSIVSYNGKRLIPAPQVSFERTYKRAENGAIVGTDLSVVLKGTLVACKGMDFTSGSPVPYTGSGYPSDSASTCSNLQSLLDMQEQVREIFKVGEEYHWFEVSSPPNAPKKWRARPVSVTFSEGNWTNVSEYTITLDLQSEETADNYTGMEESWEVNYRDDFGGIYNLRHNLSCSAKDFYDSISLAIEDGWTKAKEWISTRLAGGEYDTNNIDPDVVYNATGFNLSDYSPYDRIVSNSVNEFAGTYSVVEEFTLAKNQVYRNITVNYSQDRGGKPTVAVEGVFQSLRSTIADENKAKAAFLEWYNNGVGPYTVAQEHHARFNSCSDTLSNCPTRKTIIYNDEFSGGQQVYVSQQSRNVSFTFEYSASSNGIVEQTVNVQNNLDNCTTQITITGVIRSDVCSCDSATAIADAKSKFAAINLDSVADGVYDGTKTLVMISKSTSINYINGDLNYNVEFSDDNTNGVKHDQTISKTWSRDEHISTGKPKETTTVEGTLHAFCSSGTTIDSLKTTAEAENKESYGQLVRKVITSDDKNLTVHYSFEYDNEIANAIVDISISEKHPIERCGVTYTTLDVNITGLGDSAYDNAKSAFTAFDPAAYVTDAVQISCQKTSNQYRGTISAAYEFSTEGDVTIDVTITESSSQDDCGIIKTSVSGTIKGVCVSNVNGMEAAETAFTEHDYTVYQGDNRLISSSISRNERNASITFQYEFNNQPDAYIHEQTVAIKYDVESDITSVSIEGNITPLCNGGTKAGLLDTAETAWDTIEGTIQGIANSNMSDGDTGTLVRRQKSVNHYSGKITYSYEYENRPDKCFPNALSESINISHQYGGDVIAIIPIIGRTKGPLIQNKNSRNPDKVSVSIEVKYPRQKGCDFSMPAEISGAVNGIIDSLSCSGTKYKESDSESWNPATGQYTRQVTYICESC